MTRALVLGLLVAGCAAPRPTEAPLAATGNDAPPAATAPPRAADTRSVAGEWHEEFPGRAGCADTVTIAETAGPLEVKSADCHDGAEYQVGDMKYDGATLRVRFTVGSTGYVVRYRLDWQSDGSLAGEAEVTGAGDSKTYKVRWTR